MTKKLQKNIIYISSTKAYKLDPWISEPRLTEKLLHLFKGESWFHYLMEEKIS